MPYNNFRFMKKKEEVNLLENIYNNKYIFVKSFQFYFKILLLANISSNRIIIIITIK